MLMATHTDIQMKIQEELDKEIGKDQTVAWSDHINLPYTMATLYELQRYVTLIPINVSLTLIHGTISLSHNVCLFRHQEER